MNGDVPEIGAIYHSIFKIIAGKFRHTFPAGKPGMVLPPMVRRWLFESTQRVHTFVHGGGCAVLTNSAKVETLPARSVPAVEEFHSELSGKAGQR